MPGTDRIPLATFSDFFPSGEIRMMLPRSPSGSGAAPAFHESVVQRRIQPTIRPELQAAGPLIGMFTVGYFIVEHPTGICPTIMIEIEKGPDLLSRSYINCITPIRKARG